MPRMTDYTTEKPKLVIECVKTGEGRYDVLNTYFKGWKENRNEGLHKRSDNE